MIAGSALSFSSHSVTNKLDYGLFSSAFQAEFIALASCVFLFFRVFVLFFVSFLFVSSLLCLFRFCLLAPLFFSFPCLAFFGILLVLVGLLFASV